MNVKTLHWSIMFVINTHTATTQWDHSSVNVTVTWASLEMEPFVKVCQDYRSALTDGVNLAGVAIFNANRCGFNRNELFLFVI